MHYNGLQKTTITNKSKHTKMEKIKLTLLLFLCIGTTMVLTTSCETKAQKEAQAKAARIEAERVTEQERIAEEKRAEEERKKNVDPYLEKGWDFILRRLKCPSIASLAGYVSPKEEANTGMAREVGINGLEIAMFSVDAQNSFGAMLEVSYFVFYKYGEPKVIMEHEDLVKAIYSTYGLKNTLCMMGIND